MGYRHELIKLNDRLLERRLTWTKEDYEFLSGRKTIGGRMIGFLTPGYRTKEKLWRSGRIVYGYCYKTYADRDFLKPYLAWIIFSPMAIYEDNPELYQPILEKLTPVIEGVSKDKDHKLVNALQNPITEPKYFQLPEAYTEGKLVYVSTAYVYPDLHPEFRPGLVTIAIEPNETKEIMIVTEAMLENNAYFFSK